MLTKLTIMGAQSSCLRCLILLCVCFLATDCLHKIAKCGFPTQVLTHTLYLISKPSQYLPPLKMFMHE